MPYRLLADGVVLLHAAFVGFVVFGGFLSLKWRRVPWVHVPCALWGVLVELTGWVCPLTPVENGLWSRAGEASYRGDFIGRHLLPALYPEGLTRGVQIALGCAALAANLGIYLFLIARRQRSRGR